MPGTRQSCEPDPDPRVVALHEAGHAVACYRLWGPHRISHEVSVAPTPASAGDYDVDPLGYYTGGEVDQDEREVEAVALCAGYAAVLAAGDEFDFDEGVAAGGCTSDFKWAARRSHRPLDEVKAQAVALMERPENVRAVGALADALLARGAVSGVEAEVIICGSDDRGPDSQLDLQF